MRVDGEGCGPAGTADTAMERPSRQMAGGQEINCLDCWNVPGVRAVLADREGMFRRVVFILHISKRGECE